MKKHPKLTYLFVGMMDVTAIGITYISLKSMSLGDVSYQTWIDFVVWASILIFARTGGFFSLVGQRGIMVGWATAIEFACLLSLPFSLYTVAVIASVVIIILRRVKDNHPEPFLGPDFNAANIIISGLLAKWVYEQSHQFLGNYFFGNTTSLILSMLVYMTLSIILLSFLISIDFKINIRKVGTFKRDSLIPSLILILSGGLIGYIYNYDPFILALILLPIYLLHQSLDKINEMKLIYIDEKTGLNNYRFFDEKSADLFEEATRKETPLSIIFADMDYLRDINNNYGHQVGDQAIISIGKVIQEMGGEDHLSARFGGEEFVLISKCEKGQAMKLAEAIRIKVQDTPLVLESGEEIRLSISLGVSSFPEDSKTLAGLIKAADDALYVAKKLGRNQCQSYQSSFSETIVVKETS